MSKFKISDDFFSEEITLEDRLRFNFNYKFSKCLVEKRKELGWTQEILAQKSGVSRVTIANLEKLQRTVSVEVALKLLYALGMTIRFADLESDDIDF